MLPFSARRELAARRLVHDFLEPLLALPGVQADFLARSRLRARSIRCRALTFRGPNTATDPDRLFAAIHGDEPAGPGHGPIPDRTGPRPRYSRKFLLQAYPLCNPTGFETTVVIPAGAWI